MHISEYLPPQFVNWTTWNGTKVPCDIFGKTIDAHDPANWVTYDVAKVSGLPVAFVLSDNDPFFFIDLDNCLDQATLQWTAESTAIFQSFPGAWGEVSQSGRGLHIIGKCDPRLLSDRRHKWEGNKEFYTTKRFIAFGSGDWAPIGGTLYPDADWTRQLLSFVPKAPELGDLPEGVDPNWDGPEDDDELIRRMLISPGGAAVAFGMKASIRQLWEADPVLCQHFPDFKGDPNKFDHSSADAALMSHLAFWTGKDVQRMDRLFRRSALYRDKYEQREDYRTSTITRAAQLCTEVYRQPQRSTEPVEPVEVTNAMQGRIVDQSEVYMGVSEMIEHFKGCVYIRDMHRVLTQDGDILKSEQFKSYYGGYLFQMQPDGTKAEANAFTAFTESRAYRFPKVKRGVFDPNREPFEIVDDTVNTYVRPEVASKPGDVSPFLGFLEKILPNQNDRDILLAWCASAVQNPGRKFQWAPVLQGAEGNGKTFVANCVAWAIGTRYVHRPNAKELAEKFNAWMEHTLFAIVEEIHMSDRREILDDLKPKITNEQIEIRGMQQEKRMVTNFTKWFFCTNYKDAILKSKSDRRYAMFFTAQQSMEDIIAAGMGGDYFPNLYNWARGEGYAHVAHYLETYQIPAHLDPAGSCHRAPETSTTQMAISQSNGAIESEILESAEDGTVGFRNGFVSSWTIDKMIRERGFRLPQNKRAGVLENLGYVKAGRANRELAWEDNKRPVIFYRKDVVLEPDFTDQYIRSQGYIL